MKCYPLKLAFVAFSLLPILFVNSVAAQQFTYPTTISEEAQEAGAAIVRSEEPLPKPDDMNGWQEMWDHIEGPEVLEGERIADEFGATVTETALGDVSVLNVKPQDWTDNGKVLVYTHGGAYGLFSAASTLSAVVPVADLTGLRVVSIDYTVAPKAQWQETTSQVVSVLRALLDEGYGLEDIAIYGDSAGGGLAAGSVLKARDEGIGQVAAVVLWSPWSDITDNGDSYTTLADADPILTYENSLENAAAAYADPKDQKHPYVSPVYADYSKGFPPTLIQVGTKEIFLSNAVRHYQALDQAGIEVKLDPYDGMWHVFQAFHWRLPESELARQKMAQFLRTHLNY
jgi:monoterpene epsilon-lactone hydrolase